MLKRSLLPKKIKKTNVHNTLSKVTDRSMKLQLHFRIGYYTSIKDKRGKVLQITLVFLIIGNKCMT